MAQTTARDDLAAELAAPSLGDTVHYCLTQEDVGRITGVAVSMFGAGSGGVASPFTSASAEPGSVVAGIVTQVYSESVVSLMALADCPNGLVWLPSRVRGPGAGEWQPRP